MSEEISNIPVPPYQSRRGRPRLSRETFDEPKVTTRAQAEKATRRRRKDTGPMSGLRLSIPPHLQNDPNYRYRWCNDTPGRLDRLTKEDDWDFVTDEMTAADERNTSAGTRIERYAGTDPSGQPMKNFLLRKRREFDQEDQAAKHRVNDERMAAIRQGRTPGKEHEKGVMYVPERGITLQENKS